MALNRLNFDFDQLADWWHGDHERTAEQPEIAGWLGWDGWVSVVDSQAPPAE